MTTSGRARLLLVAQVGMLVVMLGAAVATLLLGRYAGDAAERADAVTAQRDGAAEQALTLAEQVEAACDAGTLGPPLSNACEQAEQIVAEPIPGGPPPSPRPVTTVIREEVPVSLVRSVAEGIIRSEVLPDVTAATAARVGPAVTAAVGACVASGECVGPSVPTEQVTSIVTAAVAAVCADGGCQGEPGPPGVDGAPGVPGSPPSDEQVAAAVAAYCATGACTGPTGADGVAGAPGRGIVSIDCTVGDVYLEIVFTDGTTETVACLPR